MNAVRLPHHRRLRPYGPAGYGYDPYRIQGRGRTAGARRRAILALIALLLGAAIWIGWHWK